MRSVTTPQVFIETLAEMLEVERDRKAVRLLSQNRAAALKYMSQHPAGPAGGIVAVDNFQRRAQPTQRFLGQMQTQELDFDDNSHDPRAASLVGPSP